MLKERYTGATFILEILAVLLGLIFLIPFYYVVGNSFKSFADILQITYTLPKSLDFTNYQQAIQIMNFWKSLFNSLIITIISNVVIVFFCSMAAYKLVRSKSKIATIIFFMFVAAMFIPFQLIMITLVKVCSTLNL